MFRRFLSHLQGDLYRILYYIPYTYFTYLYTYILLRTHIYIHIPTYIYIFIYIYIHFVVLNQFSAYDKFLLEDRAINAEKWRTVLLKIHVHVFQCVCAFGWCIKDIITKEICVYWRPYLHIITSLKEARTIDLDSVPKICVFLLRLEKYWNQITLSVMFVQSTFLQISIICFQSLSYK
jgi:hypothetical protein